jgi:hypothetical protein
VVDDPKHEYTADQLLADAAVAGTPVSARLITDWVAKGLLDRPTVRGLGRGRGTVATWPESQRRLFLHLLDQRRQGIKRLATLCNWPVVLWLDSEGLASDYVPLRQVRRSLATWGTAHRAGPVRAARYTAELLIEQQAGPQISQRDRMALIDAVVRATGGGRFDRDLLLDAALRVFDSERFAATWIHTIEARITALGSLDTLDDSVFETARLSINRLVPVYVEQQLGLAPEDQANVRLKIASELAETACLSLLTMLGFLELTRRQSTANSMETGTPAPSAQTHSVGGTLNA